MSQPAAVVEQLGFTFAGRDEPTLADISFTLAAGSWTVLTGRTGSGKSTLMRALAGLIPRHTSGQMQGRVLLDGVDTQSADFDVAASRVGLVLQSPDDQICTTSVAAEVAFGLENLCVPPKEIATKIDAALTQVGLHDMAAAHVHELSGGQKQRLTLASLLAMRPRLLLLDEPLSQLDPQASADLLVHLRSLHAAGMTIVIAEHRLDDVLVTADRVLVMDQGALVADRAAADVPALAASLASYDLRLPEVMQLAMQLNRPDLRTVDELAVASCPPPRTASHAVVLPPPRDVQETPLLTVDSLAFQYPGAEQPVWREVSFRVHQGERAALVGPNGSGKSTLLAVLAGFLRPAEGGSRFPSHTNVKNVPCGLVLQNPDLALFCRTVREELEFGPAQFRDDEEQIHRSADEAAAALELRRFFDQPPQALSQGERLRTAVAATLAMHPRLLLLDEPTTGQDARQVDAVMAALDELIARGDAVQGLLFSTHDLRVVARHADRVLVLADGGLLADCTPHELLADDRLLWLARLRRPPLFELRHRWGLSGLSVDALWRELQP